MKKRILSFLLALSVTAGLLTGCQTGGGTSKIEDTESLVEENKAEYDYYQELNVIDDNYRNFY